MEIVRIFAEHLYAARFDSTDSDEFEKMLDSWNDLENLEQFFEDNKDDLQGGYYGEISIEDAILDTIQQAKRLEQKLITLSQSSNENLLETLDNLFKPLNKQLGNGDFEKSKAYGGARNNWLRVYAIRVGNNLYIITGGAIKLTSTMNEREHTKRELRKLTRTIDYLKEQGIIDKDGFEEFEELEIY